MTLNAKLDALALLDYAAREEGGGSETDDAWLACAEAAMDALPELLAVARAAEAMLAETCPAVDCGRPWCRSLRAALDNLEAKP